MERRQFLTWMGLGFLVTTGPATIASCQASEISTGGQSPEGAGETAPLDVPSPPQEVSSNSQVYVMGTLADLDQKGFLAGKPDFAGATVLVIRDPQSPDILHALNATCPHNQCEVEWQSSASQFVCPCHEGKFAPDGTVVASPPTSNLTAYRASIDGDQVMVTPS
jgi:cytochrome b6-f complex iron-sulfur subunit